MGSSRIRTNRWIDSPIISFCYIFLSCFCPLLSAATDTITPNQSIRDGQTIVSAGGSFELGFFSPVSSNNRYVGIWYHDLQPQTVVWVAKIDFPLTNSTGVLTISKDGSLVLLYGRQKAIVGSPKDNSSYVSTSLIAVLLDSGNLVLRERNSNNSEIEYIWQSFEHPSDTLLPRMKLPVKTGEIKFLYSWRNASDPALGKFSFGTDGSESNQLSIWRESISYWKSDAWNDSMLTFEGIPDVNENFLFYFNKSSGGEVYFTYSSFYNKTRLVMNTNGRLEFFIWYDSGEQWKLVWWQPAYCDIYAVCGAYATCSYNNYDSDSDPGMVYDYSLSWEDNVGLRSPNCTCLPGFVPALPKDWESRDWSGGCKRKTPLQCPGEEDGFFSSETMQAADSNTTLVHPVPTTESCRTECLNTCSCTAYAYNGSSVGTYISCQLWYEDLIDIPRKVNWIEGKNRDLFIRVAASEIASNQRFCGNCGTTTIPYPLSTGLHCGDPAYRSFDCADNSTGRLLFNAVDGPYPVIKISPENRTFVISLSGYLVGNFYGAVYYRDDQSNCYNNITFLERETQLNPTLSFHLTTSNEIILRECPTSLPSLYPNCNSSTTCRKIIQEEKKCFSESSKCGSSQDVNRCSRKSPNCCSYMLGSSSSTSHSTSKFGCSQYTTILNHDLVFPVSKWSSALEIGWDSPSEPSCELPKNCRDWPHSTCKLDNTGTGKKRCICNANYQWNPVEGYCIQDDDSKQLEVSPHNERALLVITVTIATGILVSCTIVFACCLWKRKVKRKEHRESKQKETLVHMDETELSAQDFLDAHKFREDGEKGIDVPFFDVESIIAATENFSNSNKLGQGGFGPVYKGKFPGGKEIAVKRLARSSRQGLEEFKNEVLLISKLQHRNLVRLLGYCIKGDEQMLLYEYLPNKSLDSFIFDRTQCLLLNWEKRFNIIMGIARGLLYLHQDSRLRIIHRDLKTSNILLDEEMNPKISDFGTARIFRANQIEANTNRLVGTYGYMSPEYALDGFFSVKSDVFSFGVVLLEIISGKKNTGFYQSEHSLTLLGYAWGLWKEDKVLDLMDQSLHEACNACEVLKCIQVGLLCVQEDANDRPTMATIVSMLGSDTTSLPTPKQPAFITTRDISSTASSSTRPEIVSNNELTITSYEAR